MKKLDDNGRLRSISAIETHWNGHIFRSRTEARWAVFFDAQGIVYNYEPEGFKLEDGTLYLPDFYLPQVRMWAEVKPTQFTSEEQNKCKLLVEGTNQACFLLKGPPDFCDFEAIRINESWGAFKEDYQIDPDLFKFEHPELAGTGPDPDLWFPKTWQSRFVEGEWIDEAPLQEIDFSPEYQRAVYKSRAARFNRAGRPR